MPRRKRPLQAGCVYHVYNRGNNRQLVFPADTDYRFFLHAMHEYLGVTPTARDGPVGTTLLAYCLMPNHFHLVLRPEDVCLSARVQRQLISFTKTMNGKYGRVGALFQGQLQAVLVETDLQLVHLSAYVHQNPVQTGLVRRPEDWEYSSYREYLGSRPGTLPNPGLVLELCGGRGTYRALVEASKQSTPESLQRLVLEE